MRLAIILVVEATIAATAQVRSASAETLEAALAYTYKNNPQLEAQRAQVRAVDESVPQALAGYRPKASVSTGVGYQRQNSLTREISSTTPAGAAASYFKQTGANTPQSYGVTLTQNLFNGFQTSNKTRQAEALVLAARATLRVTEQAVLLNAVTAYLNLLRDSAILDLLRRNREVLEEQLRQTRVRMQSGNVTATDVSQAEARLNVARTQVFSAEANYAGSRALYREVIGLDANKLAPASTIDRFAPTTLNNAIARALADHPTVAAAQYTVDAAALQTKIAEGALYPTVNLVGTAQKNYETSLNQLESFSASVGGQMTMPLYQGGAEYSLIRQAKETQGQKQIELSVARDRARTGVMQAWAQVEAAKLSLGSTRAQVKSAEAALNGVREEARLGQRTTLDVLNAQQELVNARIAVVSAERDRVVNSYTLLAAVGGLTPQAIGLKVPVYDAKTHYNAVRDAWSGIRTPDGR
ncbi:MAG: TolC family outer membrane protein [Rhodopseudomonas sp.]|nr:TolC family outer membrane protein [Rhodopseudomonas sp.]